MSFDAVDDLSRCLVHCSMRNGFGLTPHPWQDAIGSHLNKMLCSASNIAPGPVMLCQPTGGGKSLVRDTFAVAHGGITWCISPLLSLAADQVTKLQQQAALSSIVAMIHLDEEHTRDASKLRQLCLQLASIPKSSSSTIIVFSSPQILVNNLLVRNLFHTLSLNHDDSKKNGLTLLAIDEVRLFAQFGLYFQDEFLQLRPLVFDKLRIGGTRQSNNSYRSMVPILFMSATVTIFMVEQLEAMTGFSLQASNIFWPDVVGMRQRSVFVSVAVGVAMH